MPLEDLRITLIAGAFHPKHTSGGDLQEATRRAIRQGLEKARSVVLEPYYRFIIDVDTDYMGRVLSDITRLHGSFLPPETRAGSARIEGSGPVAEFMEYPAEVMLFTRGTGAISLMYDHYAPCHAQEEVVQAIGYDRTRDTVHVSSSVFCAKGAGFEVKWEEAERMMHLPK